LKPPPKALYRCDKCGKVFDEENLLTTTDNITIHGFPRTEEYWVSPCCRYSFTEGVECSVCGKFAEVTITSLSGEEYCEDCRDVVRSKYNNFKASLSKQEETIFLRLCEEGM
jgi:rubredoxin